MITTFAGRAILCLTSFFFFVSCKTQSALPVGAAAEESKKASIHISKGPYQASTTHQWDLLHTRIALFMNWQAQEMDATAELQLKPWFYKQDSLWLDAKYMRLHGIEEWKNGSWSPVQYRYDSLKLKLALSRAYLRFDTLRLKIRYTAQPSKVKATASDAITDNRGLYFINPRQEFPFKPRQVWSQGETESASCWFPTIDSPNEKTTQEMIITAEKKQTVLSNGKRISVIENPDGTKTEIWKQQLPHAPYLFMIAIGEFAEHTETWRGKPVQYLVEREYAANAPVVFKHTPEMIEFFSKRLNYPFPWEKYAQVVVRDFVSGAMENTSASVFMEELQCDANALADRSWDGIIAHELFHQWFGDIVTCESWANLPLNESFANYSEYLWQEYKYGRAEADIHDEEEEDGYLQEAQEQQNPLIRYHYEDKEEMFDAHSYNKGGRVLHMLRKYLGDEAFFESLHLYLKRNEYKTVEIHDLRLAFEEVCGEDLNWFFNQWFFKPGHAELKARHEYVPGKLKIYVQQVQDTTIGVSAYQLPMQVEWWIGGKSYRKTVWVRQREQWVEVPVPSKPDNVVFDAEFQLLGRIFYEKEEAAWIHQWRHHPYYKARSSALEWLFANPEQTESHNPFLKNERIAVFKEALVDSIWAIRLQALSQLSIYPYPALQELLPILKKIALEDPKPKVRGYALSLLASISLQDYSSLYQEAMKANSWYVQATGMKFFLRLEDPTKDQVLQKYEALLPWEIVKVVAEYHLSSKNKNQYAWFKEKLLKLNGRPLYYFIGYFGEYLRLLDSDLRKDGVVWLKKVQDYQKGARIKAICAKYIKELE